MAYDPNLPPWAQPQPDVAPPEPAPLPPATLPPWAREEEPVDVVAAEEPIEPQAPLSEPTGAFAPDLGDTQLKAPAGLPGMDIVPVAAPEQPREFAVEPSLGEAPELTPPPVAQTGADLAAMEAPWEQEAAAGPADVAPADLTDDALMARRMEQVGAAQEEADIKRAAAREAITDQEEALAIENKMNLMRLEELNAQQAEQAKVKVDPNRFYKNQSTGQKIIGLIAAFASGWLQGKKGGRNIYLDHMQAEVQRDINAQLADIENERRGLGQAVGNVKELMNAGVREKQAAYLTHDRAMLDIDQQLANEQAKFLPGGTSAEAIEGARRDLQARRAAARADAEKDMRAEAREEADLQRKILKERRGWVDMMLKDRKKGGGKGKGSGVPRGKFGPSKDTVFLGDRDPKAEPIYGFVGKDGTPIAIRVFGSAQRDELSSAMRGVQSSRNLRASIARLGGVQRKFAIGQIGAKERMVAGQEALDAVIKMAKAMGGTVTDNDIKVSEKIIPNDPMKIFQKLDVAEALYENYVKMNERNLRDVTKRATGHELDLAMGSGGKTPTPREPGQSAAGIGQTTKFDPSTGETVRRTNAEMLGDVQELFAEVEAGQLDPKELYRVLTQREAEVGDPAVKAMLRTQRSMLYRNHIDPKGEASAAERAVMPFADIIQAAKAEKERAALRGAGIVPPWEESRGRPATPGESVPPVQGPENIPDRPWPPTDRWGGN